MIRRPRRSEGLQSGFRAVARAVVAMLLVVSGCAPSATPPVGSSPIGPPSPPTAVPSPASSPLGEEPTAAPTPAPTLAPDARPGLDWATADVQRPPFMSGEEPSIPPVTGGGLGHPGHFTGQGHLVDVVAGPGGRLVAVGYAFPGWLASAWTSDDGAHWIHHDIGAGEETFLFAVTTDGARYVAVGRAGAAAAAWTSTDGVAWQRAPDGPALHGEPEARMTSVVHGPSGFVAGGWAGLFTEPVEPRFWTSPDGLAWTPAGELAAAGDDGRVLSIAVGPSGLLAVGTTGPEAAPTGSAAWTSSDGTTWTRSTDSLPGEGGLMVSAMPTGTGFLVVGSDLDERRAIAWTSTDGRDPWTASPEQPSLENHGLKIRMTDVTSSGGRFVAVGDYLFGTQYGNATSWTSPDGLTWTQAPRAAALNQGEMLAITAGSSNLVSVGSFGAPDNYVPTVWLSPLPGD